MEAVESASSVIDLTRNSNSMEHECRGVKRSRSAKISRDTSSTRTYCDASTSTSTSGLDFLQQAESSRDAMSHHPRRFAGDGLDMRRPMAAAFVDLTESDDEDSEGLTHQHDNAHLPPPLRSLPLPTEYRAPAELRPASRQPRFPRNIINIEDSPETQYHSRPPLSYSYWNQQHQDNGDANNDRNFAPGGLFGWITRPAVPQPHEPRTLPSLTGPRTTLPTQPTLNALPRTTNVDVIDITDEDDEVVIQGVRQVNNPPARTQTRTAALYNRLRTYADARIQNLATLPPMPRTLDFMTQGFQYQVFRDPIDERIATQPQPTAYDPLETCADGFTRSPREGDVLVCPACDEELCIVDDDNDKTKKGEIWVVKQCGHVYCGHCATGRPKKAPVKGKGKKAASISTEFTVCRAAGCTSKVTGKQAMIQLFL